MEIKVALISAVFLLACFGIENGTAENILFIHPVSTYSHRISVWPLVKRLVAKGHQITFISPYPNKTPLANVTEIQPEPMSSFVLEYIHGDLDVSKRVDGTIGLMQDNAPVAGAITCRMLFESPQIKKWLESNPHYDLVVIDWFVSECSLGLAYKFKAKSMFFASSTMIPSYYELFGVTPDSSAVPEFEYHVSTPMSYWGRFRTTLQHLIWLYKMSVYFDTLTDTIREKLNVPEMPHVTDLAKQASIVLWNEYFIDGYPQATPPNFIRVAGMHCQETISPLPQDLASFVSKSNTGFVFISLGSGVNPNNLPKEFQDVFVNSIRKFSHVQFIWKWADKKRADIPPNLYIGDWFPQQDILGHPKLIAFVTQGGRPSIQEAICHKAPVVGLPVFGDQDLNVERLKGLGGAVVLQISELTESTFLGALKEISDKKYKQKMTELSKVFLDLPMKPADTALWWTEYVLRNKDTTHLQSMSINLPWYKRRLLDIWGLVFITLTVSVFAVVHVLKSLLGICFKSKKPKRD